MFNKRLVLWVLIISLFVLLFSPFITIVPESINSSEEPKIVEKKVDWYQELADASGRLSLAINELNSARFAADVKNLSQEDIEALLLLADSLKEPADNMKKASQILKRNKESKDSGSPYLLLCFVLVLVTIYLPISFVINFRKRMGKKRKRRI